MKRAVFLLALAGLLAWLLPVQAIQAAGVAMGPAGIEISVVRGQTYQRTATVYNPSSSEPMDYTLRVEGEASSWIHLLDFGTGTPIETLHIDAASSTYVIIEIRVPSETPNSTYKAIVYVETAPVANIDGTGVSAILQAHSELSIIVGGEQTVDGVLYDVTVRDIEPGLPLRLGVQFRNTGNVAVNPAISCAISKDNTLVAEFGHAATSVMAGTEAVIPVEWADTAGLSGDYVAQVRVSLPDRLIGTREVPFRVLPPGTLTKTGELVDLTFEGEPGLGTTLRIEGNFRSTGQADCLAKLMLEAYCNGDLVEAVESEEGLVPVGETRPLTAYLKPGKSGDYTVKGFAAYNGKQTEVKDISFTVPGKSSRMGTALIIGGAGLGALLVAGGGAALMRRRKPGTRAQKRYAS